MDSGASRVEFSYPRLRPAETAGAIDLQLAAIEYTLASPIIINDRSDIQSARHWSEHLEPFEHQVRNLITYCRRAPVALVADDVGLGKTISAGLILSELATRKKVKRALVLAPKILLSQWDEELRSKFRMRPAHGVGAELDGLLRSQSQVIVTTYASARSRMATIQQAGFDMIILDEAHKLRNLFGTANPPQMATALKGALEAGAFRYVLMLTATPIQNRLWDLYSLIDLLSTAKRHTNPLGTPSGFVTQYVADGKTRARVLRPESSSQFRTRLAEYMVRTRRQDANLVFPSRTVRTVACPKGDVEIQLESLVKASLPHLSRLQKVSIAEGLMSSPAALARQLQSMVTSGSATSKAAARAKQIAEASPLGCKLRFLQDLAAELRAQQGANWRMVVFTRRVETQRAIGEAMNAAGASVGHIGGGHGHSQDRDIAAFKASPPTVNVLISTDAGAEGVNLQAANVVVNYDLPWNPMVVEQRIGRVQRLASEHASVVVVNLVVEDSVEELVVARLLEKLQAIASTIGEIEGILEATNDDEDKFSEDLTTLVLQALEGQDVTAALERMRSSIERAKQLYDEERQTVEETVGNLDAMHTSGPKPPDLTRATPRVPVPTFVGSANRAAGAVVQELADGRLQINEPGKAPRVVTFDDQDPELRRAPGYFGGKSTVLYEPGEAPFERLVGSWDVLRQHAVERRDTQPEVVAASVAATWPASLGNDVELSAANVTAKTPLFEGVVQVRVSASVAHDGYEKLLDVPIDYDPSLDGTALPSDVDDAFFVGREIATDRLPEYAVRTIGDAIVQDRDIDAFSTFYRSRRDEELSRAKGDSAKTKMILSNFEPILRAEIVAMSGVGSSLVEVEAKYHYGGSPAYRSLLTVDTGTGSLLNQPALGTCALTERNVPAGDLRTCAISDKTALAHLLTHSEISDRYALPEHASRCDVTGRIALSDEVGQSEASGRTVSLAELQRCAVSHVLAATDELETCEFTKVKALPGQLAVSEVSGRKYRTDEAARSAMSGRTGHRDEFVTCEATGDIVLSEETGTSWHSAKRVRRDLLDASDKDPGRLGLKSEFATCVISGKRLLLGEMVASLVSGALADADLMLKSAVSERYALPEELITCEESGTQVLPDETSVCMATGKRVRSDALEASTLSGKSVIRRLLHTCPETGERGLDDEFETCQRTGLRVAPRALVTCSVTGERVVKRLTVRCPGCGDYLLREHAVAASDGSTGHEHHLETSMGTERTHFVGHMKRCRATGILLEPEHFTDQGVLSVIAKAANQSAAGHADDHASRHKVNGILAGFGVRAQRVWTCELIGTDFLAVFVEWSQMLGFVRKYGACVIDARRDRVVGAFADAQPAPRNWDPSHHGVVDGDWRFVTREG